MKLNPKKYAVYAFLALPVLALALLCIGAAAPVVCAFLAVFILFAWLPLTFAVFMATRKTREILGTMEIRPDLPRV